MTQLASLLIALPVVLFSAEHKAMCLVGVGDPMPALALQTPTGQQMKIGQLQGERATVVAVHGKGGWMTDTLLADLGPDVADPYVSRGVRVVAIGLDTTATTPTGVTALRLSQQAANQALGEGRGPRVYVLNREGKIVWLDIEYSLATRRELHTVIESLVADESPSVSNSSLSN